MFEHPAPKGELTASKSFVTKVANWWSPAMLSGLEKKITNSGFSCSPNKLIGLNMQNLAGEGCGSIVLKKFLEKKNEKRKAGFYALQEFLL